VGIVRGQKGYTMSNVKILTITSKQLDMFTKMFTPIEVKAESKPRDQHAAGDKAHDKVRSNIRLTAACAAVRKWMDQKGATARFHYAFRNERFQQFGDAEVVKSDRHTQIITVKAMWNSTGKETKPEYETFHFTWKQWEAKMNEMRPLALKKNKQGQPCHRVI
jgi:hypothetical protein